MPAIGVVDVDVGRHHAGPLVLIYLGVSAAQSELIVATFFFFFFRLIHFNIQYKCIIYSFFFVSVFIYDKGRFDDSL